MERNPNEVLVQDIPRVIMRTSTQVYGFQAHCIYHYKCCVFGKTEATSPVITTNGHLKSTNTQGCEGFVLDTNQWSL